MRKTYKIALIVVVSIAIQFWSRKGYDYYLSVPIGATFNGSDSKLITNVPFYRQDDTKWRNDKLANKYDTLGASGCTLCCLAMALDAVGVRKDPKQLNRDLTDVGGYDRNGNIIWSMVEKANGKKILIVKPDESAILKSINAGKPVLVKIRIMEGITHWVLVVGYERGRYVIHDPLVEPGKHKYLDEITDYIDGVRLIN